MYLEKLEINGFGRIDHLSLKLKKGINIIYGKNESGKSTILWFIRGMLYGLKGGRPMKDGDLPPLKKYKPWTGNSFRGSLEYSLDNECFFRADRDFDRNTVEIHDSSYNNITSSFDVSRERGLLFADRQLGINDTCFDRTVMVKQQETRLDDEGSRELLNRLVNLNQTGFDDISFKKAEEALKDALRKYAGTERTTAQPIDRINARLAELSETRDSYLEKRYQYETSSRLLQDAILLNENLKKSKDYLNKVRNLIDLRIKLDSNNKKLPEMLGLEEKLLMLERELYEASSGQNGICDNKDSMELPKRRRETDGHKNGRTHIAFAVFPVFLSAAGAWLSWSLDVPVIYRIVSGIIVTSVFFALYFRFVFKINKTKPGRAGENIKQDYDARLHKMQKLNEGLKLITSKASLLCGKQIDDSKMIKGEIQYTRDLIANHRMGLSSGIDSLIAAYPDITSDLFSPSVLEDIIMNGSTAWLEDSFDYEMEKLTGSENDTSLKTREYETVLKSYNEEYGKLQNIEEEVISLEIKRSEMERTGKSLKIALEVLTESSAEIKGNYAPKLNSLMSEIISGITGSRYVDIKGDDALLLKAAVPESGVIKNAMALSGGTADQMYLALRLAMAGLITKGRESLPLLLDEIFSQYDDERTAKTLEYLQKEYAKGQIILFTCKSRELEIAKAVCGEGINIIEMCH